jgi:hypothetical protein
MTPQDFALAIWIVLAAVHVVEAAAALRARRAAAAVAQERRSV